MHSSVIHFPFYLHLTFLMLFLFLKFHFIIRITIIHLNHCKGFRIFLVSPYFQVYYSLLVFLYPKANIQTTVRISIIVSFYVPNTYSSILNIDNRPLKTKRPYNSFELLQRFQNFLSFPLFLGLLFTISLSLSQIHSLLKTAHQPPIYTLKPFHVYKSEYPDNSKNLYNGLILCSKHMLQHFKILTIDL